MSEKLKKLICESVDADPEEITPDAVLSTDLGLCSLDLAMLAAGIEKEFGILITPKIFAQAKTFGALSAYIEENKT